MFGRLGGGVGDIDGPSIDRGSKGFIIFLGGWGMSGILDAQKTIHLCWSLLGIWVELSVGGRDGGGLVVVEV